MKLLLLLVLGCVGVEEAACSHGDDVQTASTLTLLHEAAATKGALCLDGSPPGYYFRPGSGSGADKWILHLMGGGWCFLGTEDCYNRSKTIYGTSIKWPSTYTFEGALSSNSAMNPSFYNWNMVFFMYCDGASFAGDREEPVPYNGEELYYRGYRILNAIMDDLNTRRGLNNATDVVLTGCSAGGLAVYMHANYISTLIPVTAKYRAFPDAGFFIDIPSYNKTIEVSSFFMNLIKYQNIDKALINECVDDHTSEEVWKCMYAPYIYKYIKTPIFVLNSRYDRVQIKGLFQLPCLPPNCTGEEMDYFNFFEKSFTSQIRVVTESTNKDSGYFLDSCLTHCQTMDNHPWTQFKVDGVSISQAMYSWYYEEEQSRKEDCDYPCNPTCPGVYPPDHRHSKQ